VTIHRIIDIVALMIASVFLTAGPLVAGEASTSPPGKQMSQDQVIKLALSASLLILPKKQRSYQDPVKLKFK
jgi:hypothetical protein